MKSAKWRHLVSVLDTTGRRRRAVGRTRRQTDRHTARSRWNIVWYGHRSGPGHLLRDAPTASSVARPGPARAGSGRPEVGIWGSIKADNCRIAHRSSTSSTSCRRCNYSRGGEKISDEI